MVTINATTGDTIINATVDDITINVTITNIVTNNYVNEDIKFLFDGSSGDTYFKYNSTTNRLELYVDGNKQSEWG